MESCVVALENNHPNARSTLIPPRKTDARLPALERLYPPVMSLLTQTNPVAVVSLEAMSVPQDGPPPPPVLLQMDTRDGLSAEMDSRHSSGAASPPPPPSALP
uniref:Uncharacterized protein n=1 Tax=Knipowitschia caucasica TaxID=637954 RepID=A0AAV2L0S2_KNICA